MIQILIPNSNFPPNETLRGNTKPFHPNQACHSCPASFLMLLFLLLFNINIIWIMQAATKILARQLVRLRQQIANLQGSRAQMRGIATHTQVCCQSAFVCLYVCVRERLRLLHCMCNALLAIFVHLCRQCMPSPQLLLV